MEMQLKPDWVTVEENAQTEERANPKNQEKKMMLNPLECAVFDYAMKNLKHAEILDKEYIASKNPKDMNHQARPYWANAKKGKEWFLKNNEHAYQQLFN